MHPQKSVLSNYIEPWLKLYMLKGLMSFDITFSIESPSIKTGYFRVTAILKNIQSGYEMGGVAEGTSVFQAKLRAAAEAYERICFNQSNISPIKSFPYGLGVGLRKESAIRRAYGEFYERQYLSILQNSGNQLETETKSFETPFGRVYIAIFYNGLMGSGYGFTKREAQDSAFRSYLRVKDIPQESPFFKSTEDLPKLIRVTPKDKWLECYFVGFVN